MRACSPSGMPRPLVADSEDHTALVCSRTDDDWRGWIGVFQGIIHELPESQLDQFRVHEDQRQGLWNYDLDLPAFRQWFQLLERGGNQETCRMQTPVQLELTAFNSRHLNG